MSNQAYPTRAEMKTATLAVLTSDQASQPAKQEDKMDITTNPMYMTSDLDSSQQNAGFRIIHAMPTSETVNGNRLFKVLGRRYDLIGADREVTEYVTWMWEEGTQTYFWGHYFSIPGNVNEADYAVAVRNTYHKALKDLIER